MSSSSRICTSARAPAPYNSVHHSTIFRVAWWLGNGPFPGTNREVLRLEAGLENTQPLDSKCVTSIIIVILAVRVGRGSRALRKGRAPDAEGFSPLVNKALALVPSHHKHHHDSLEQPPPKSPPVWRAGRHSILLNQTDPV